MSSNSARSFLSEIRKLTSHLNELTAFLKDINEQFKQRHNSEIKLYKSFNSTIVKLLKSQEIKCSKICDTFNTSNNIDKSP